MVTESFGAIREPDSSLHRFYFPTLGPQGTLISLDSSQTRHATQVLRLRAGDQVELFNGQGGVAQGVLQPTADAKRTGIRVQLGKLTQLDVPTPRIDIGAALPKGSLVADMVATLSQLGADQFIPLQTDRSVTNPRRGKLDRIRRVAIESARQCRRANLLTVQEPIVFGDLPFDFYDKCLIATPGGPTPVDPGRGLRDAKRILLLIGPEGGWSKDELMLASNAGCQSWQLGPHVLRIETAAAAAVAIIRHVLHADRPQT